MTSMMLMLVSFLVSWRATVWILQRAERIGLAQNPTHRSSHEQPTPTAGGLGIVIASTITGTWLVLGERSPFWAPIFLALPLAVTGLIDDILHLSARIRLVLQVIVCAGLMAVLGVIPEIAFGSNLLRGLMLSGLVLLAGVWWINLFNFMDGIDGIAGVQAMFMLLAGAAFATWASPQSMASPVWVLMGCVATATLGFLLVNWPPAKIFMGDTGSTWLAFMIFALALLTIQSEWLNYAVWVVLGAFFVTDATVTLLTRMVRGERWYEAHCNHAYQRLARRWRGDRNIGHRSVTLLVAAIDLLWLLPLAWACLRLPQWTLGWIALAYTPLVFGVVALGAGRAGDDQ